METAPSFKITRDWLVAGKAIFTVHNDKGEHYTYKISRKEGNERFPKPVWFVSVLTDGNNDGDYTYLGMLDSTTGVVRLTAASRFNLRSPAYRVVKWAAALVFEGRDFPPNYGIAGCGRCGRCGRTLTHPDGVTDAGYRLGFGESCFVKMGAA